MNLRYCITTMNRPVELQQAVDAALQSDIPLDGVVVIDNSSEHYAQQLVGDRATIITLPHNAGLGPALNLCFALYSDFIVCANDDLMVLPHSVRRLVEEATAHPETALFYGAHDGESMFSLFLLRKQAFLEVGGFDPAIWPVYYDDLDLLYRLKLVGYTPVTVQDATYSHVKNGTIKALDPARRALHDRQFARNEAYYRAKWGGLKFEETFTVPFGGQRPSVPPFVE
jgi:GT2 family glycosyltransferase